MAVQNFTSASRGSLGTATDTLAYGSAVGAGSTLFAVIRMGSAATLSSVTDSVNGIGNPWTLIGPVINGGGEQYFAYFPNTGLGTPTLTFTFSASGQSPRYALGEITTATSASHDVDASNTGTATALTGGATATTAQANEAWIGAFSIGTNETFTASGAWTILGVEPGAGSSRVVIVYQEVTATGTPNAAVTASSSFAFIGQTVTFKETGGGGGTTPSSTDSASVSESTPSIGLSGPSDSSTTTESAAVGLGTVDSGSVAEQTAIALSQTDPAAFAEQVALAAATSAQDSAALAEQIRIALQDVDSAHLGEQLAIALAHQDSATLSELVAVALAIADTATATEQATTTAQVSATDAATVGESASQTSSGGPNNGSETGTTSETATVAAAVSAADAAALAEQAAIRLGATDVASLAEQIALGLSLADNASLAEQLQIAVAASATDAAALSDVQATVAALLAAADTAHVGESASVTTAGVSQTPFKVFVAQARTLAGFVAHTRPFIFLAKVTP